MGKILQYLVSFKRFKRRGVLFRIAIFIPCAVAYIIGQALVAVLLPIQLIIILITGHKWMFLSDLLNSLAGYTDGLYEYVVYLSEELPRFVPKFVRSDI